MQIRMLANRFAAGGVLSYVAGGTYDVPNDLALQFIGDNVAVEVNNSRAAATGTQRDEFNRGAEGQAAVSLVSGAGSSRSTGGHQKIISAQGSAISSGITVVTQWPARRRAFSGLRAIYENKGGSSYTITTGMVFSTATHQEAAAPATSVTFASGVVVPAAVSGTSNDIVPSLYDTGLIALKSVARTDDTSKMALAQFRTYFAAAANGTAIGGTDFATLNASAFANGQQWASRTPSGDATATFTGSQAPLESGNWIVPASVFFYYDGIQCDTLAAVGDSLQRGQGSTINSVGWPNLLAVLMTTETREVSPANFGWSGQTHAASVATARQVVPTLKPRYLAFASMSPNDASAGNFTQAIFDAGYMRTLDLIEYCRTNGVIPVVRTIPPFAGASTLAENNRRKEHNAAIRALSSVAVIVDADAALDPLGANTLGAYDSGDQVHWNNAGYAAVAAAGLAAMRAAGV